MSTTTRALLLTDVVDSTTLSQGLGDVRMMQVWAGHDRLARDLLAAFQGREIDKSDGFLLLFDDARAAAAYALAYHRAIASLDPPLRARAGLHIGEVILSENPAADIVRGAKPVEVLGLAKPMAARIMALAVGGQTLLSEAAGVALAPLPDGWEIHRRGHYRLGGVAEPVALFELGVRGESVFAPPADTAKAYRVIASGAMWRPAREIPHSLPAEADAFVGRSEELQALATRFERGERLVTVTGMGGTGKTRLVRRYARAWLGDWPGGAHFCDLCVARSAGGIAFAVATALGVTLGTDDPVVQLGHAIAARGKCLLILDNFEQVSALAASTLGAWMARADEAGFVVTSRVVLGVPGEHVMPLESLDADRAGVELFVVRAQARRSDFALTPSNLPLVREIVTLLDGLPLAIELAAARAALLAPKQLLERLKDRFALLVGARGAQARQATLRSAIDWSWELLSPWEQAALAQASVFAGGFTLAAAESVLDLSAWPQAPSVMDVVQSLVDKSLLRAWAEGSDKRWVIDEPYFGMYVSIHEYALEKLRTDGALAAGTSGTLAERAACERHGRYFARFGTDEALNALATHGGGARQHALALDLDNLVTACRRAVGRGDAPAAGGNFAAAWAVFESKGPYLVAAELGIQLLDLGTLAAADRCRVSYLVGDALRLGGRMEQARQRYEGALAIAREAGDRRAEGQVLRRLGGLGWHQGRMEEAHQLCEAALAIFRASGDRRAEGIVLGVLGNVVSEWGRKEDAVRHREDAVAIYREVGDRHLESNGLNNLGVLHQEQGCRERAREDYENAAAIAREVGDRRMEGHALGNLGGLHVSRGSLDDAQRVLHEALAIAREAGNRRFEGNVRRQLGTLHEAQGRIDEALSDFEEALAIHRAIGNRHGEGVVLVCLGELHVAQGQLSQAREALAAGEALFRGIGDRWELGLLLCSRGECERLALDIPAAQQFLVQAEALAHGLPVSADSDLGQQIARFRAALNAPATASAAPPFPT